MNNSSKPLSVKVLIFDLDGTLIDTRVDIANSVNWTLRDIQLPPIPNETIYASVGYGVRHLIHQSIGEGHQDLYQEAMKLFDQYYTAHLFDHTTLFPGIEDVLEYYQKKSMAIVTNKPQKFTDTLMEGLNLKKYFPLVLGREAVKERKPDPEVIYHVLRHFHVDPGDAVIIGDTEVDIQAGRRAGIHTCGILYGFGSENRLMVEKPEIVVREPFELKRLFK